MTKHQMLDDLLQRNNGYLRTSDALAIGITRTYLGDFVQKHGLERTAQGLYMAPDAWTDGMYVLQVRYPEAVFSHETALCLLNFADREPTRFSLTVKTGTNTAALSKQGVKAYKVKEELFELGLSEAQSPAGHTLRVFNAERTVCDLIRSRSNIEAQELQTALKEYVRLREKNVPQLMRYAKAFSVEKIVRQYMEVLL